MADNIQLLNARFKDDLAAKDVSGTKHQRVIPQFMVSGTPTDTDATAPFPVELSNNGISSSGNSTTTPLSGGATFTGDWEDILNYSAITVIGSANVVGTMSYEFSSDGVTVDHTELLSNGMTTDFGIHGLVPVAAKGRVKLVNGSSAQSSMNIEVIYSTHPKIALPTSRASQVVGDYSDVLNVRALSDPFLDEANSKQADRQAIRVYGRNPAITGTEEDILFTGGLYTGFLQSASALRIKVGGSAADDAAGDNARSIIVRGLDENWDMAEATIITAGASASSDTTVTFIRVHEIHVVDVGVYGNANAGDIIIETTGGIQVADVEALRGASQLAIYSVPNGFKAFVRRVAASVDGNKPATIYFYEREDADDTSAPVRSKRIWEEIAELSGAFSDPLLSYAGPFASKTDLWAAAIVSTGTAQVSAEFDIVLVRE